MIGIGGELPDGGYQGLDGDIVVHSRILDSAFGLSSMGIRVEPRALERRLEIRGLTERRELYFHKRLLAGEPPLCIGGGIGRSRLCLPFL